MLKILLARAHQGHRTMAYPKALPVLPDRFRGVPSLDPSRCEASSSGCRKCAEACPTAALTVEPAGPALDLGRCLFCADCVPACPAGAIAFGQDHRLSARTRDELIVRGSVGPKVRALEGWLGRIKRA